MSWRCSVPGCGKRNQAKAKDVVIHRFPEKDSELCHKWLAAIGRDGNKTERKKYTSLRVCSQHFRPEDYERDLKGELLGCPPKKVLKKTAVPSIFQTKRNPSRRPPQTQNTTQAEVSSEEENAPTPLSTCSEMDEMSWVKANKSLQTSQGSNVFKSREVSVNAQCLLELFQFCRLCKKECCIAIEGNEGLFAVTQDCQSCGFHRDWTSHPPAAEPAQTLHNEEEHVQKHDRVVVKAEASGNESSEQSHGEVFTVEDGENLHSGDGAEGNLQEQEVRIRKRKAKRQDSSDEQELSSGEEDTDPDASMDEDLFAVLKEEGEGKLLVWCTQCETEASRSCSVHRNRTQFCCVQCRTGDDVQTHNSETLPVRFDDISSFQTHAEQEHGVKPFCILCQECGNLVTAKKEHVCEPKVNIVCPDCGKRFISEAGLKTHYTTLHSEYDHPCKYCLKVFKTRTAKLHHEQTHPPKEEQPYSCPDCPEKFDNIYKRNNHVKSHRGPYKYVCDVCEKGFRDITRLKRHKLVHSGEKPFKCQVCERSFTRTENLTAHMRLHTGERPFGCDRCGETFNHKVSLKKHKLRQHNSDVSQEKR